jgi:APA family basic amino acid/polyamine antiporter
MIGLGPTIGPTIFVVPRLAVEMAGPAAILTFILAGILSLFIALNYAAMSSRVTKAGGGYSFVSYAFGGVPAFLSGWFMYIGNVAYAALSAYTAAISLSHMVPIPDVEIAALVLALFTLLNVVGVRKASGAQVALMSFVVFVLLLFILFGVVKVDITRFEPFALFGYHPVFLSLGYVFSIYIGFELIANVSEEVKRAHRIVPKAIIATIVIALVLFPTIIAVMVGILDYASIVSSEAPLVSAAFNLSPLFGLLMVFSSVVASLGSLNASVIASSRTLYSLSRDEHIPRVFESIHSSFRTPYFALLFTFILTLLLIFMFRIELLVYISDLGYLLGLTIINPAGIFIKKRGRHSTLSILIPIIALVSTVVILPTISRTAMIVGLILTAIGCALALVEKMIKAKRRIEGVKR